MKNKEDKKKAIAEALESLEFLTKIKVKKRKTTKRIYTPSPGISVPNKKFLELTKDW